MKFELRWLNCLWLILPLLAWNLILGPKLNDPRITSDAHSPRWLLVAENVARIAVFALPLLLPLALKTPLGKAGLALYSLGIFLYFASWLPLLLAPHSAWSSSVIGLLAPCLTPLIVFAGIALIGHSWVYGTAALVFTLLHTLHGIQNFMK